MSSNKHHMSESPRATSSSAEGNVTPKIREASSTVEDCQLSLGRQLEIVLEDRLGHSPDEMPLYAKPRRMAPGTAPPHRGKQKHGFARGFDSLAGKSLGTFDF